MASLGNFKPKKVQKWAQNCPNQAFFDKTAPLDLINDKTFNNNKI